MTNLAIKCDICGKLEECKKFISVELWEYNIDDLEANDQVDSVDVCKKCLKEVKKLLKLVKEKKSVKRGKTYSKRIKR